MKKFLKSLALGFAMCFGLFAFVACGDGQFGQASVNVGGNYATCDDKTEVADLFAGEEFESQNLGYKMTVKVNGSSQGMSVNLVSTFVVTMSDELEVTGFAGKMSGTYSAQGQSMSSNVEVYAREEGDEEESTMYLYTNMSAAGFTTKTKMEIDGSALSTIAQYTDGFNAEDILMNFQQALADEGIALEKATAGNQVKYKVTVNGADLYVVFENGYLTGMKVVTTSDYDGIDANIEVNVVIFDGVISYPGDLASYTDAFAA